MRQGMGGQTQRFAPPNMSQASPEAIEAFRELLKSYAEDGVFEDWELQKLAAEGQNSGYLPSQQKRLMSEFKAIVGIPIRVWSDSISCEGLKAGYRGEVVLKPCPTRRVFEMPFCSSSRVRGKHRGFTADHFASSARSQTVHRDSQSVTWFPQSDALLQLETRAGTTVVL